MVVASKGPINPIVKWPGGKRKLAKQLIGMMPPHQCYVEVFFGGGALFFSRDQRAKCEVINDINGELINLYRVVQCDIDALLQEMKWSISSRALFQMYKIIDPAQLNQVQRAARFLFLQSHSFGGKVSGQTFGTDTTRGAPNIAAIKDRLVAAHARLNGVYVENLSWQACMQRYDRKHTAFYLDPPYWKLTGYGVQFGWEQYEEMAAIMASAAGKVVLSINDHPDIRRLFSAFRCHEVAVRYTIGRQQKTSGELILCNW